MAWMIFVATSLIAAGIGAGFFLGTVPIVVFSVLGLAFIIWMHYAIKGVPGGTSAGIGMAFFVLAALLFLIPMWATAIVVRLGGIALSVDWSGIGEWLRRVFLR